MRIFLSIIFLLVAMVIDAGSLEACSCTVNPPQSDIEFVGKVINMRRKRDFRLEVLFKVSKVMRGKVGNVAIVTTKSTASLCGYPFQKEELYVVKADYTEGVMFSTSSCYGNKRLLKTEDEAKTEDESTTDKGTEPEEVPEELEVEIDFIWDE